MSNYQFQVPDNLRANEWHPELGPPFPANWKPSTKDSKLVISSCYSSWFCCWLECCPDSTVSDIMWRNDRLQTNPKFSRGPRDYDAFYGVPTIAGKYSHNFEGRKPQRPNAIKVMDQQPHHYGNYGNNLNNNNANPNMMMMTPTMTTTTTTMLPEQQHQRPNNMNPQLVSQQRNINNKPSSQSETEVQNQTFSPVAATATATTAVSSSLQQQQHQQQLGAGSASTSQTPTNNATGSSAPATSVTHEPMVTPTAESKQMNQQQQQQYVNGFARYIGIDPDREPQLLGLAQQCLATPAPPPWQQVRDPSSGRMYYANAQTNETSWDHPLLATFKERVVQWRQHYALQQQKQKQQKESVDTNTNTNSSHAAPTTTNAPATNPLSKQAASTNNNKSSSGLVCENVGDTISDHEGEVKVTASATINSNNNINSNSNENQQQQQQLQKVQDPHRVPSPEKR